MNSFGHLTRLTKTFAPSLLALCLCACSGYQMVLNETVVYSPPSLLTDFRVLDRKLQTCLDQTIKDNGHTAFEQVTRLSCTHAGINSVEGLQVFPKLAELNLGHNQLTSVQTLQFLPQLKILLLNNNQLTSVAELLLLTRLQQVNLQQNPDLDCSDIAQLQGSIEASVLKPEQCEG